MQLFTWREVVHPRYITFSYNNIKIQNYLASFGNYKFLLLLCSLSYNPRNKS